MNSRRLMCCPQSQDARYHNQPTLHADIKSYFDTAPCAEVERCETIGEEHGRLEIRTHSVFHSVDWIASERSYPGVPRFAKLATIAMVESRIERGDKIESERRSYISSRALSAAAFADAVRGHWAIENNLHWTFDVTFNGTSHACEPVTGPRTWRWYATSRSIWCAKPQTNDRSSGAASAPHTIPNTLLQILGALRC
jgi:predicted transposase YbfD/YdcC